MPRMIVTELDLAVARRVRAAMADVGINARDLCEVLDRPPLAVHALLSDRRKRAPMTCGQFAVLACFLAERGVRLGYLLTGQGPIRQEGQGA